MRTAYSLLANPMVTCALEQLVTSAGFAITRLWTDAAEQFWMAYLLAA